MNDQLEHYGVLGMRWGHRKSKSNLSKFFQNRKIKKQRLNSLKKAREARIAKQKYEASKQKALKSGTASDVLKFKGDLTNEQMSSAIDRITLEKKLSNLSSDSVSKGEQYLSTFKKDILTPAITDVSRQLVKSGLTYTTNKLLNTYTPMKNDEYKIYTNNKKK